jgi:hypothetical protein
MYLMDWFVTGPRVHEVGDTHLFTLTHISFPVSV